MYQWNLTMDVAGAMERLPLGRCCNISPSLRWMWSFQKSAFGNASEGGVAPNGWCWICGSTKDLLSFELEILLKKGALAHPLCRNCKDNKAGKFRILSQKKIRASPPTFEVNDLVMASFSHGENIIFHAAKIVSPIVNLGSLAYRIRFFDSVNEADNTNRYVDQLRPFVKKGDLVMADWRLGEPYEACITLIHIPSATSSSSASTLPAIKVNVKFIADGETLSNLPITRIKVPKAKVVETFTEKKKKRGVAKSSGNGKSSGRSAMKKKISEAPKSFIEVPKIF